MRCLRHQPRRHRRRHGPVTGVARYQPRHPRDGHAPAPSTQTPAPTPQGWSQPCPGGCPHPSPTCLLAKTRRTASRSSSSASIRISSSRASFTRSRSLLSTTKINPGDSERTLLEAQDPAGPTATPLPGKPRPTVATPAVRGDTTTPTLGILEVMPPEGSDLVLPTHVPHGETDVLVFHRLHVEPCGKRQRRETEARGAASPLSRSPDGEGSLPSAPSLPLRTPMVGMVVTISPSFSL